MNQQEAISICEMTGCSMPGTICPACDQCFCWQHLQSSSCEICHRLLSQRSFEARCGRLVGVGISVLLFGLLFLFMPRDTNGVVIQLAITFLAGGTLLFWVGLLART